MSRRTTSGNWAAAPTEAGALLLLTAVAGGLDVLALVYLGGALVSIQTGNVMILAISLFNPNLDDAAATVASLVSFFAGATLIACALPMEAFVDGRRPSLARFIGVQFVLVALSAGLAWRTDLTGALLVPLGMAMGIQAAMGRRLRIPYLSGGFITGSTTDFVMGSPIGDGSDRSWWLGGLPVVALAVGAAVTVFVADHSVPAALALLALVTGLVALRARQKAGVPEGS